MLPLTTSDSSNYHHHRGFSMSGGGAMKHGIYAAMSVVPRSKRLTVVRAVKMSLLLCLALPIVFMLRDLSRQPKKSRVVLTEDDPSYVNESDEQNDSVAIQPVSTQQSRAAINRKVLADSIPKTGAHLKHLILVGRLSFSFTLGMLDTSGKVAGHAVYVGKDYSEATKEASWFLEEYQKVPGEAASFVEHIRLGIQEAAADPDAMLLFSGGQTRLAAGPRSEGLSYWVVAEAANWFDTKGVRERTFTEEHARDSFENLMFSMCRFYELSGHYPDMVTVVSYTLKEQRFRQLHREAIRFPIHRFKFVGSDIPPAATGAQAGEARTVESFKKDPYGCGGELLEKKLRRDPFAVGPPHFSRCPELKTLLAYCGPNLFSAKLPWNR